MNASLRWLHNVRGVCVPSTGFLASYCSAGIGAFLQVSALLSIGSRIVQILRQLLIQVASQSTCTFIKAKLYSTCDKQEWPKQAANIIEPK